MAAAARARAHTPQESLVLLVRPRHRPESLPAVPAQLVQAPVVAGARIRVRLDDSRDVRTRDTGIGIGFGVPVAMPAWSSAFSAR